MNGLLDFIIGVEKGKKHIFKKLQIIIVNPDYYCKTLEYNLVMFIHGQLFISHQSANHHNCNECPLAPRTFSTQKSIYLARTVQTYPSSKYRYCPVAVKIRKKKKNICKNSECFNKIISAFITR